MWKWFLALDAVLRGEVTRPSQLRGGQVQVPLGGLTVLIIMLGATYGFCMVVLSCFCYPERHFHLVFQAIYHFLRIW